MSTVLKRTKPVQAASAVLLTGLFLFLSALASSPELHQWLHNDAHSASHDCVVKLFANGQVDIAGAAAAVPVAAEFFGSLALRPIDLFLPSADYRYSSSRAPPSFFA
jgi:hypothetical protein